MFDKALHLRIISDSDGRGNGSKGGPVAMARLGHGAMEHDGMGQWWGVGGG